MRCYWKRFLTASACPSAAAGRRAGHARGRGSSPLSKAGADLPVGTDQHTVRIGSFVAGNHATVVGAKLADQVRCIRAGDRSSLEEIIVAVPLTTSSQRTTNQGRHYNSSRLHGNPLQ